MYDFYAKLEKLILESTDDKTLTTPAAVLAEIGAPTTSIAILDDGNITSHCISTIDDNTDTIFQACSISKPTAGMAIMKLIELGKFSLDSRAIDFLPSEIVSGLTAKPISDGLWSKVTVKQLLSHTAGLSVGGFPGYPDRNNVPTAAQLLIGASGTNTQPIRFFSQPGHDFHYSGGGIMVLQCIVEHVMQRSFAEVMREYIFEPLNMTRSFYSPLPSDEKNVSRCYYHGYTPCEVDWHILPEQAAGGLWSTPTDLLKLVQAMQDSLSGKPGSLLKPETAKLMLTTVKSSIALTWFTTAMHFEHGGSNNPGWRCYLAGWADLPWNATKKDKQSVSIAGPKNAGIAIMTNAAHGDILYRKLLHAISFLKGWPGIPAVPPFMDFGCPLKYRMEGPIAENAWKPWLGEWECDDEASGLLTWKIAEHDGDPIAGTDDGVMLSLKPAAVSPKLYASGKKSIDLVVDGLRMMFRLGWNDKGEKTAELWSDGTNSWKIFRQRQQ